jgi:RNA polymerase sigma-70 factor (ECF subfamily)
MTRESPSTRVVTFLAALPDRALAGRSRAELERAPGLDEKLQAILEAAAAAWPGVALSPDAFLSYLAARLQAGNRAGGVELGLERLRASDLYLAWACARRDPVALAAFDALFSREVDRALARLQVPPSFAEDVKQSIRCRLLVAKGGQQEPQILEYSGYGTLRGWVRSIAVHDALNLLQRDRLARFGSDDQLGDLRALDDDPELAHFKHLYAGEVRAALASAMAGLAARQRALLRQHLVDGLSLEQLGVLYQVHRATAARWLKDARSTLVVTTRAALTARLRVGDSQLDSIMRLVHSRLDLSIHGLLTEKRGK